MYEDDENYYNIRISASGDIFLDVSTSITFEDDKTDTYICPSIAIAYDTMIELSIGELSRAF